MHPAEAAERPGKWAGRDRGGPGPAFLLRGLAARHARSSPAQQHLHAAPVPAPLNEDFESARFPPAGWSVLNPDPSSITWEYATGVSGYGSGAGSAWMDFYSYEISPGQRDELRTPAVTGLAAADSLSFDYAYAEYDDPFYGPDSLIITLSTNGGATFPITLFADGGPSLATAAATTLPFSPAAGEWRTLRLGLPAGVAGAQVVVSFVGVNGYSNNLYIDNIFLGSVPANDMQALSVLAPASGSKQRTSFIPRGIIRNAGTAAQSSVPTRFQVLGPSGSVLYDNAVVAGAVAAGASDTVTFPSFTAPATPGTYSARLVTRLIGDQNSGNDTVVAPFYRPASLAGVLTVGPGGVLPTLRAAVDTLNHNDVAGPLTFRLIASSYAEAAPLTLSAADGAGPSSPVTFTPQPGLVVSVAVAGTPEQSYAIGLRGVSYVRLSGGTPPGSLSITATGTDGAAAVYIGGVQGKPAGHNVLENLELRTGADSLNSSSGYYGVLVAGYDETQKDTGNTIAGCSITRHGQAGIAVQNSHGLRVESCSITDWTQWNGFADLRGVWLFSGVTATTVRGNVIGNIRNLVNGWWAFGIENGSGAGSSLLCTNNSIWGIASTGAGSDANVAAGIWSSTPLNSGDRYLYNSVFLYGTDNSTASGSRSSAFELTSPAPSGLRIRNGIAVNTTVHGSGGPLVHAYGIFVPASSWPAGDTCDRNDWWTPGASGATGYFNGAVRSTLAQWRTATGQDAGSLAADPRFVNSRDLHIALGTSPVGNAGLPVAGEDIDIDGEVRSAVTPDLGCDEFGASHIAVGVQLLEGWNMIANPVRVQTGRDSVRDLYPSALAPYAFTFTPAAGYIQHTVLENGRGYWEKFAAAGYAYPSGDIVLADTLALQQGWNMVGSLSVPVDTGSVVTVPSGIRASAWYTFGGGYIPAAVLLPGRGYWVKASAPGEIILAGSPPTGSVRNVRNSGAFSR